MIEPTVSTVPVAIGTPLQAPSPDGRHTPGHPEAANAKIRFALEPSNRPQRLRRGVRAGTQMPLKFKMFRACFHNLGRGPKSGVPSSRVARPVGPGLANLRRCVITLSQVSGTFVGVYRQPVRNLIRRIIIVAFF
jgi:hypothetical protein